MPKTEVISRSAKETQKIAQIFADELVKHQVSNKAMVIALEGELGSGKTTFSQGLAKALGVNEKVLSPTFVLLKIYPIKKVNRFRHLVHIDCYRLKAAKDLLHLGFGNLLKDQDAIIVIEWAGRIKKLLPKDAIWLKFKHGTKISERLLTL